jgi:hypothetical protein
LERYCWGDLIYQQEKLSIITSTVTHHWPLLLTLCILHASQAVSVNCTTAALWRGEVAAAEQFFFVTSLTTGTPYYVRVSAMATATGALTNGLSTAPAAVAAVAPAVQVPGKPTSITATFSRGVLGLVVSDKLLVRWVAPAENNLLGKFAAAVESASPIKQYVLQASTSADFSTALLEYTTTTLTSCAAPGGCSFPLGATVQTITVYAEDGLPLTAGAYKLSAAGYSGDTACIPYNDALATMETELEALFGVSAGSINVQREAINAPAPGFKYFITFAGLERAAPLLSTITGDDCAKFSSAPVITVATDYNSSSSSSSSGGFTAGTAYYVRVAAKRGAVIGPFAAAVAVTETPRAPPGAPLSATVTADTATAGVLHVSWTAVDTDNGSPVTGYIVEYQIAGNSWAEGANTIAVAADSSPAVLTTASVGNICTDAVEVRVRAVNSEGASAWTAAAPTCPPDVKSCVEPAPDAIIPTAILRRRLPLLPTLTVPQHKPMGANAFTKNSLVVSMATNGADIDGCAALAVDYWKVSCFA